MTRGRLFDDAYGEEAVLKNGTAVRLRLVCRSDKELILEAWERLSPESRYRRCLTPKNALSDEELRFLTEVDYIDHLALGATRERGGRIEGLGVARFVRFADRPEVADIAITVVAEAQRNGLGRLLLTRLIAAARERGIERFACDVLATNDAMRRLIKNVAPQATERFEGTTFQVEIPLREEAHRGRDGSEELRIACGCAG